MKTLLKIICITLMISLLVSCSGKNDNNEDNVIVDTSGEHLTLSILEIGDDYFTAEHPWASPRNYKVFAALDQDYCVGDYVDVYYKDMLEKEDYNFEISNALIVESDFELKPGVAYKPLIYLYPTEKTEISVSLVYKGILTHTYPEYLNGWNVIAYPNGTLVDFVGTKYPYLFWEGESNIEYDMSKGFCITGNETEHFLIDKLTYMGLNEKELNEFIKFWLPFMKDNPFNKICFQTTIYTENAELVVTPTPDCMLRIFMVFQPLEEFIEIEEQQLDKFERTGFAVIEWGGSITK